VFAIDEIETIQQHYTHGTERINAWWPVTPKSVPPKIGPAGPILAEKPAKIGPAGPILAAKIGPPLPKSVPPLKWLYYPSCIAAWMYYD